MFVGVFVSCFDEVSSLALAQGDLVVFPLVVRLDDPEVSEVVDLLETFAVGDLTEAFVVEAEALPDFGGDEETDKLLALLLLDLEFSLSILACSLFTIALSSS